MSMLAVYVEVPAEELSELLRDPSPVPDLFDLGMSCGSFELSPEARARFERDAPAMFADALSRYDPATQEALMHQLERLGVDIGALRSGGARAALLALMQARGTGGEPPGDPLAGPGDANGHHPTLSLDKAWHGVHYLLCGKREPVPGPLGSVVLGGTDIGEDDLGYGPARYFPPAEVDDVAAELRGAGLEDEVAARYEPARMTTLEIYPGGWETSDGDWLFDAFRDLRDFFAEAQARGSAVLTCLV
jgi:hypothetical protein